MDPLSAGIIGGTTLIGSAMNMFGGLSSSEKNYKLQKKVFAWQKEAQQKTWDREDNAVQRRAADLKAAGMNRLLAAGSGAATSSPIHVDAPQAPDLSHIGDPIVQAAQAALSARKQKADVSQTEAQTRLVMGQLDTVNKQNELLQRTIDWYKNHPETAPNVPGSAGANAFQIGSELLNRTAGRLGDWIGRKWAETDSKIRKNSVSYNDYYRSSYNFFRKDGLSHEEASARANRYATKMKSN